MRNTMTTSRTVRPTTASPTAFTLLELLVVISIIVLLVALLLPALRAARITAQKVTSLSNVRQTSISLHIYAGDNDGSMPFSQALTSADYSVSNPLPVCDA